MAALDGLRVLDLTRLLPGGFATLMLADLGADVIKIEEPGRGDYIRWSPPMVGEHSSGHLALNRNKRSLTLNLKSDRGRDVFLSLAQRADVVIESFRPGVMDRLGIGYAALSEANPGLIYCAISGFGQDGPRSQQAGHDLNYMGYAGALSITGEERPVVPGVQVGDLAGGAMSAAIAILAALHARERTGRGDFCDISMTDGVVSWLSIHAAAYFATGEIPKGGRTPLAGLFPCYRIYPAADGWITVGALEPQFWQALCEAIDRPDLIGDAYSTGSRRDEVIAELEDLFGKKTRAEWMEQLAGLDVCVGPVNDFGETFADDQIQARGMVATADVPGIGEWRHLGNPIRIGPPSDEFLRHPPPRMGEHTDELLGEIGLSADEIAALRDAGAI
jgi:crotonobetainyl-CoA:carnitine CoA-transferase CaiB-like acyl-CoA transferase